MQNLFEAIASGEGGEFFETLLENKNLKLERIVSRGHSTPIGEWCDQNRPEWVVLLKGSAGLRIEGESEAKVMRPGDYQYIPAHLRHRVEWTESESETVWLALHHS